MRVLNNPMPHRTVTGIRTLSLSSPSPTFKSIANSDAKYLAKKYDARFGHVYRVMLSPSAKRNVPIAKSTPESKV